MYINNSKLFHLILLIILISQVTCSKRVDRPVAVSMLTLSGSVDIVSKNGARGAGAGDTLSQGESLVTGKGSTVILSVKNCPVNLFDSSAMGLRGTVTNRDGGVTARYLLKGGALFGRVPDPAGGHGISVATEITRCETGNGDFLVKSEKGKTLVACFRGKLRAGFRNESEGDMVTIAGGHYLVAEPGRPLRVRPLPEKTARGYKEYLSESADMTRTVPGGASFFPFPWDEADGSSGSRGKPGSREPSPLDERFQSIQSKPLMDVPKVK